MCQGPQSGDGSHQDPDVELDDGPKSGACLVEGRVHTGTFLGFDELPKADG